MNQQSHPQIVARVRPPRFVVGYVPHQDWIYDARRALASICRIWGGNGAIPLPIHESGADSILQPFLRLYDPDHVAVHVPVLEDVAHHDPSVIDRIFERYRTNETTREDVWQRFSTYPLHDAWHKLADLVAEQVDHCCSPFKEIGQDHRHFQSGAIKWIARNEITEGDLPSISDQPDEITYVLDLSQIDSSVALMIETRIGTLDRISRDNRNVIELPTSERDIQILLHVAIAGATSFRRWKFQPNRSDEQGDRDTDESTIYLEDLVAASPLARCGQLTTTLHTAIPQPPIVCVVGDTAEDHALAVVCDRLFQHAVWIPPNLLTEKTDFTTTIMLAFNELANTTTRSTRNQILVTSVSETAVRVEEFVSALTGNLTFGLHPGSPISVSERFRAVSPSELARERGRSIQADTKAFMIRRRIPVTHEKGDVSMLTPLTLPEPQALERLGSSAHWCVDVSMPGHQVPPRTGISSESLQQLPVGAIPEAIIRASRDGLTYNSANFGLVLSGMPRDAHLAEPLLRFPEALGIFSELARAMNARLEVSPAGYRSRIAAEMWGSHMKIAADLTGSVRNLLNAFLPPHKASGNYNHGYEIRGKGYLAIEDVAAVLELQENEADMIEARKQLDRLLVLSVLKEGFLLYCSRCRTYDFYEVGLVGRTFICATCGHVSTLSFGQWCSQDAEPHRYYSLDQVVRDLLKDHGDVPLLAAAKLSSGSYSTLWCPEIRLTELASKATVELDICLAVNDLVIVGEAKSNDTLKAGKNTEEAARRLVIGAQLLRADEIVLATSRPRWVEGTMDAVQKAVAKHWTQGPRPSVIEITNVGIG